MFQSCRDGATASWVLPVLLGRYMYLNQGYNTATRVRIEPPTFRSDIRRSTTRPRHLPNLYLCCRPSGYCTKWLSTEIYKRLSTEDTCDLAVDRDQTTNLVQQLQQVQEKPSPFFTCVGAAKLIFSDEVNEALLSQQQADVFTWNHCGEDAYNYLNHSLKLSIPFSHFQIQKSSYMST